MITRITLPVSCSFTLVIYQHFCEAGWWSSSLNKAKISRFISVLSCLCRRRIIRSRAPLWESCHGNLESPPSLFIISNHRFALEPCQTWWIGGTKDVLRKNILSFPCILFYLRALLLPVFRAYFAPQNHYINSRSYSDAKLPLVTWRLSGNHIVTSWSFGQSWATALWRHFS